MLGSLGMVAVALAVGLVLQQFLAVSNIALVFLTAVLAARSPMACGRRCSPASSACWPTISFSCRRSTPSPSPIPKTSSRCSSSRSWP
jgi:K+-sensing histidine kinase KdpD